MPNQIKVDAQTYATLRALVEWALTCPVGVSNATLRALDEDIIRHLPDNPIFSREGASVEQWLLTDTSVLIEMTDILTLETSYVDIVNG